MAVTVYTKPGCIHCDRTKDYMNRLGISYDEVDVTQDDEARSKLVDEWGFRVVPVVETGEDVWSGFKPDKIKEIDE